MTIKYRSLTPFPHPFADLMTGALGRDIGQVLGRDDMDRTTPGVNITTSPDGTVISLLLPGFSKEHVQITVEKNVLTVKAEKPEIPLEAGQRYLRREFAARGSSRSFRLQEPMDLDGIRAEFLNGVLNVHIRKAGPTKPSTRSITID